MTTTPATTIPTIKVPSSAKKKLDTYARKTGRSRLNIAEQAILEYLRTHNGNKEG